MAAFLLLLPSLFHLTHAQGPQIYVPIGRGVACVGKSGPLGAYGLSDKEISWELQGIYNPQGVLVGERGLYSNKSLRMSICGAMDPSVASCAGDPEDSTWCFEEVRK